MGVAELDDVEEDAEDVDAADDASFPLSLLMMAEACERASTRPATSHM